MKPIARGAWMIVGIGVAGLVAVLCKENGALLPMYAWIIDAILLRGRASTLPPTLRALRALLLFTPLVLWPPIC